MTFLKIKKNYHPVLGSGTTCHPLAVFTAFWTGLEFRLSNLRRTADKIFPYTDLLIALWLYQTIVRPKYEWNFLNPRRLSWTFLLFFLFYRKIRSDFFGFPVLFVKKYWNPKEFRNGIRFRIQKSVGFLMKGPPRPHELSMIGKNGYCIGRRGIQILVSRRTMDKKNPIWADKTSVNRNRDTGFPPDQILRNISGERRKSRWMEPSKKYEIQWIYKKKRLPICRREIRKVPKIRQNDGSQTENYQAVSVGIPTFCHTRILFFRVS